MTKSFEDVSAEVTATDSQWIERAREHHARLTKPAGSLGRLEELGAQLCAIAESCPPPPARPVAIVVFAGDHGVVAEGVTPWPSEVTAQMVANFATGGAAINVLARALGATMSVVDVAVSSELPAELAIRRFRVANGTRNLAREAAMSEAELTAALDVGVRLAGEAVDDGARLLVPGDMGIGNTTASAALICAVTGAAPAEVTGRGTGIDDATLALKTAVIESALSRLAAGAGAREIVRQVGGLEIAAIAGFMVGGAARRVPVVVDGVISVAAALVATALVPEVTGYLIAGHRSSEPGARYGLEYLGLRALLELDLRLGEGSGAALAVPLVQAAADVMAEMATFDAAGVSARDES